MGARIMIVEDEEPLALLLRYNLEAEGYEVETVARGDDADTRLREGAPDLAVLDWMLPGLSGIELCRRLRARPETKALPIILLTARGSARRSIAAARPTRSAPCAAPATRWTTASGGLPRSEVVAFPAHMSNGDYWMLRRRGGWLYTLSRHRPPTGPAFGRPDDRLRR